MVLLYSTPTTLAMVSSLKPRLDQPQKSTRDTKQTGEKLCGVTNIHHQSDGKFHRHRLQNRVRNHSFLSQRLCVCRMRIFCTDSAYRIIEDRIMETVSHHSALNYSVNSVSSPQSSRNSVPNRLCSPSAIRCALRVSPFFLIQFWFNAHVTPDYPRRSLSPGG